jgi:hypothetical protein
VAADGTLYGVGFWNGSLALFRFGTDGSELGRWTLALEEGVFLEAFAWGADGALYAAGSVGVLPNPDALLVKLSPEGTVLWTRSVGTADPYPRGIEFGHAVAARPGGGVCLGGSTTSSLEGNNQGVADAFVACYDGEGQLLWLRQWGTPAVDRTVGLAADATGLYALLPGVLIRYDAGGNLVWQIPLYTKDNVPLVSWSLALASGGGAYVAGEAVYDLGFGRKERYVVLNRYDSQGRPLSSRLLGSGGRQEGLAVAAEAGGVYLAGATEGRFPGQSSQGGWNAFLAHFRP